MAVCGDVLNAQTNTGDFHVSSHITMTMIDGSVVMEALLTLLLASCGGAGEDGVAHLWPYLHETCTERFVLYLPKVNQKVPVQPEESQ